MIDTPWLSGSLPQTFAPVPLHSSDAAEREHDVASLRLCLHWVLALGVDPEVLERLLRFLNVELAVACQPREGGGGDGFGVHLEVFAQVVAIVAATEPVGAERGQPPLQPWRKLVWHDLHVVSCGDDGTFGALKDVQDVRTAFLVTRMQPVP